MVYSLVSPTARLYRVADQEQLEALLKQLNVHADVKKYVRQLCNFTKLPTDRKNKHLACGWVLLHNVRWLKREGDDILHAAFGGTPRRDARGEREGAS